MKAELHGVPQLEKALEQKLGKKATQRISDSALKKGAKVFVSVINREIGRRPDKGYAKGRTVKGTSISEPMTLRGVRTVKIHWNDGKGTYRLIHLNEFGTVINPRPPRKGAIAVALKSGESAYMDVIKSELRRSL